MLFASIDIGSNAGRLLFANATLEEGKSKVEKVELIRVPLRLGEGVFKEGIISADKAKELITTIQAFKLLIEVYKPIDVVAAATAAMREATNGKELVKKIKKTTGIELKIIDGLKEAELIRSSNDYDIPNSNRLTMYIDVGGGSTEISVVDKNKLIDLRSFRLGTLRILNGQVPSGEWTEMNDWLLQFRDYFGKINVIGSGGNINKIVKLFGRPDDNVLIINNLRYGMRQLIQLSVGERMARYSLRPDRADVIVPASEIYLRIMELIRAESILVPKIGLSDGLIHHLFRNYLANLEKKNPPKSLARLR
ncbi:MAG: hypothetical protein LWX70_01550 [Sphingobacteriia bacterium]|nr:hypothetical protein [Sphingobacteriia bacterium]